MGGEREESGEVQTCEMGWLSLLPEVRTGLREADGDLSANMVRARVCGTCLQRCPSTDTCDLAVRTRPKEKYRNHRLWLVFEVLRLGTSRGRVGGEEPGLMGESRVWRGCWIHSLRCGRASLEEHEASCQGGIWVILSHSCPP